MKEDDQKLVAGNEGNARSFASLRIVSIQSESFRRQNSLLKGTNQLTRGEALTSPKQAICRITFSPCRLTQLRVLHMNGCR